MAVANGSLTCGTSATKVVTAGASGVILYASATGVFVGGPNVAISGANSGIPLAATTPVFFPGTRIVASGTVPAGPDNTCDIYVISSAGTQVVSFFTPGGN